MALVTKHIMNDAHKGNAVFTIHFIAEKAFIQLNKTEQFSYKSKWAYEYQNIYKKANAPASQ